MRAGYSWQALLQEVVSHLQSRALPLLARRVRALQAALNPRASVLDPDPGHQANVQVPHEQRWVHAPSIRVLGFASALHVLWIAAIWCRLKCIRHLMASIAAHAMCRVPDCHLVLSKREAARD